ncbi:MAG: DUF4317 domain-containing protein [Eubacterium sp.]|nr:DUF4317 domain-containing protein [Eubacterium sp.]
MNKKDISELKRRLKKESCTITRMCGCYVDSERNRVVKLGETFLNLDEDEFYKYLEIAKKTLSGTIGNNLLELEFPMEEEATGGRQQFLMALRASELKNDELLERFYDLIIDNYDYAGNYLILIFHDAYDVIMKTHDNNKLDESEEVYEYLICAVCPVSLSKPGLGYRANENRIGPRVRDWVVGLPESGFIFPAFTDRSADIHAVMTYHKNVKEPHTELMEDILGCTARRTATEQKIAFESIVKKAFGGDEDTSQEVFYDIQQGLSDMANEAGDKADEEEPVRLTSKHVGEIMAESNVPENAAAMIENSYQKEFEEEAPFLENLIDTKAVEAGSKLRQNKELVQKVASLQQQLEDTRMLLPASEADDADPGNIKTYDVILRVKPEKASQIKSQYIGGQKCLVIPMEENEHAAINGVNTTV